MSVNLGVRTIGTFSRPVYRRFGGLRSNSARRALSSTSASNDGLRGLRERLFVFLPGARADDVAGFFGTLPSFAESPLPYLTPCVSVDVSTMPRQKLVDWEDSRLLPGTESKRLKHPFHQPAPAGRSMLRQRAYSRKTFRRRGRPRKTKGNRPGTSATPGFEGTRELCQVVVESPDRRGKYVEVTKNIGGCWSSTVRARGQLVSAVEKAGDRFQYLYESRTFGQVQAAWYFPAKKGKRSGSVPVRALLAGQQLVELQCRLGRHGFLALELICGLGLTLKEATQRYFGRNASWEDEARLLELLFEALDRLALHWGYASRRNARRKRSRIDQA